MDIKLFDYDLPPELIAQFPTKRRGQSRLMVLDRKTGKTEIHPFRAVVNYFNKDDALVINNTRVFKARLIGHRSTGAAVEVFLVRPSDQSAINSNITLKVWEALVRPSRRMKEIEQIGFDANNFVTLEENLGDGKWIVSFKSESAEKRIISKFGHIPLPQYIDRQDDLKDIERYQTVFARKDKAEAVAAPTAGLHFTTSLLHQIKEKGVKIVEVTLDVGTGTFKPVKVDEIENHVVDSEKATLSPQAAAAINQIRKKGGRIVAVGTTSVRTLESAPIRDGQILPFSGGVDLYIKPGFKFRVVDSVLTNFHLSRSSLLILVSAFAGRDKILSTYQDAIKNQLRFYSYGDAMLIL